MRRDGVEVPADEHALRSSELGARDDRVAMPGDHQVRDLPKGCLDGIGEWAFVARLAGNVHEHGGQAHGPRGEVQGWDRGHVDTVAV